MSSKCQPFPIEELCAGVFGVLFGEVIEETRREHGLSTARAARRAGMPASEWQAVERGRVPRTWPRIYAMAEALGKSRMWMNSMVVLHAAAWGEGRTGEGIPLALAGN
jgi:hypothetical protein